MGLGIEIYF